MHAQSLPTILTLPQELLFSIFKYLSRASRISLALTAPFFLHLLARYHNQYRGPNINCSDPGAQPAIIRRLCTFHVDPLSCSSEARPQNGAESGAIRASNGRLSKTLRRPGIDTYRIAEDTAVQNILSAWLQDRFRIEGGCIVCDQCGRYMLVHGPDGMASECFMKMEMGIWITHCGGCKAAFYRWL
ncbi:hypothetical protein B0J14DRAFT_573182 [Halenospora varia]|nr:hypothetical protein B0J14DRAFT_573182 [Halenospora varia]